MIANAVEWARPQGFWRDECAKRPEALEALYAEEKALAKPLV